MRPRETHNRLPERHQTRIERDLVALARKSVKEERVQRRLLCLPGVVRTGLIPVRAGTLLRLIYELWRLRNDR